ncbi:hypothetical protein Tco_0568451 [Tanacetum coccineum]
MKPDWPLLPLDELIGNLKVYEMVLDNDGIASKTTKEKVKSLALKATVTRDQTSDDSDSQEGGDEDIDEKEAEAFNLLARNFCKFFHKGSPGILEVKLLKQPYPNTAAFQDCGILMFMILVFCDDVSNEDMDNQSVHTMQGFEQTPIADFIDNGVKQIKLTLYDGSVISKQHGASPVFDNEETLILEEVSRSKMLAKQNDPISKEKKVNTTQINYAELNRLSEDFGKHFVSQQELSDEQAFWLQTSHPNTDQSASSPVKIEAPRELPKLVISDSTVPKLQTAEDLQGDALLHYDAEMELMNLILLSIPNEIYNSVDACTTAKEILQPEWLKYVTQVRLAKRLTVDSFDDLFDYLQQFEKLVNASRAKKNTSSYYVTHPTSVVDYDDEYQQDDVQTNSEDPLASAMLLLARAITQNFSNPTNNHLRTSSNTRNQAIIQGDRVNIQSRNSGNTGRNTRRAYVQEEVVEGSNAQNETGNVQRTLQTSSSGNTHLFQCYNANGKGHFDRYSTDDNTSDAGTSYDSAFISEVQSASIKDNQEQMYQTHTKIINSTIGDDQIDSNIIFDEPNRHANSGSVEKDTHVPDLYALEQLARNAYKEAEKQQLFAQKVQQQNMTLTSQLELYKESITPRVLGSLTSSINSLYTVMSDSDESGVTHTEISSPFEDLSDIGSPGVVGPEHEGLPWMLDDPYVQVALQAPPSPDYIPGPEEPQSPPLPGFIPEPVYPEYMSQEDEVFLAEEQPLPAAASPTAQSPDYVLESDPEADPEEDDNEDPEEDPVDYPADGGDDGDDEDESSEDDEDDDEVDIEADDDEEEEEHLAPADFAVVALPATDQAPSAEETEPFETDESTATPPPNPAYHVTARISIPTLVPTPVWSDAEIPLPPLPPIPSPSLPVSSPVPVLSPSPPASPIRPLGYQAAMIQLRAEAASTSHSLPLPPPIILSHTRPAAPSSRTPHLHLLSTDRREDRPEVTLPPRKRLCIALGPAYEVRESSSTAAARPAGGLRADYGFVATMDREIRRNPERDVGYGITDSWDEIVETLHGAPVSTDTELGRHMTAFETRVRQDTDEIYTRLDDEQSGRQLLASWLNMLFRNRRAHPHTARLMETKARMSR